MSTLMNGMKITLSPRHQLGSTEMPLDLKEALARNGPLLAQGAEPPKEKQSESVAIMKYLWDDDMKPQMVPSKFAGCSSLKDTMAVIRVGQKRKSSQQIEEEARIRRKAMADENGQRQ